MINNFFILFFILFFVSCSNHDSNKFIITDENFEFNIDNNKNFKKSIINHFNNFGIDHNPNDIVINDINKNKYNVYNNILQKTTHVDYIAIHPEEVFNLINLVNINDRELLLECINAFIRYHAVKPL